MSKIQSISFIKDGQEIKRLLLRHRGEIVSDRYIQKLLEMYYEKAEVVCMCRKDIDVRMHIKNFKGTFNIASNPNNAEKHFDSCMFKHDGAFEIEKNEIIAEPYLFREVHSRREGKSSGGNIEGHARTSFNSLIEFVMDKAYSHAFNIVNAKKDRLSGELSNIPIIKFYVCFNNHLSDIKVGSGRADFKKYAKKHKLKYFYGIVTGYKEEGDNVIIKSLDSMYNSEKEFTEKSFSVTADVFNSALLNVKIYKNYIEPPYFYFSIYDTEAKKTVRLFFYAIDVLWKDNKAGSVIIPVESGLEREKLRPYAEKYALYKPIATRGLRNSLGESLVGEVEKVLEIRSVVDFRPDAIVFKDGKAVFVEVAGYIEDEKYKRSLKYKEDRIYGPLSQMPCFGYKII